MCRAGWKCFGRDELFPRPDAGQWIEAVCQGLPEHHNVGFQAEMLEGPEFSGAMDSHLDFVDYDQNAALVEDARQFLEIAPGRDHVSARALDRLDVERGEFRL